MSSLPVSSRRLPLWRGVGIVCAVSGLICLGMGESQAQAVAEAATSASQTRSAAAQASHCQHLIAQFDVAWPTHQKAAHAARGHKSRDLGEAQCNAGHYVEGVRNLKHALHDIGIKAVRTSPVR